jgi:soluble lytic murein transglycosylase-like protein
MLTKTVKMIGQIISFGFIVVAYSDLTNALPVAVKIKENVVFEEIKKDIKSLEPSVSRLTELSNAVYTSHQSTGLNPKLIIALMYTESGFNKNAIGPKNRTNIRYKGLMQTPSATHFSDVDTLHGARILREKLQITDQNLREALALYKGGRNSIARGQADHVLKIYHQLQKREIL